MFPRFATTAGAVLLSVSVLALLPRDSQAATRDALATVEQNRPRIVARMASEHADALQRHRVSVDAFAAALWELRAEDLLVASLADSFEGVSMIVAQANAGRPAPKDGPGSGANSWIGYTGGSNQATGTKSAVTAGWFNLASGQNSFVGAGQSNVASGTSSLVIGGFDNQAIAIDSLVGAGAGNRATGARSTVVGGGYNLAAGAWSFIGGGGRQNGGGGAGANGEDNVAGGDFSVVVGGQSNDATGKYASVLGGASNFGGADLATVGGGGGNQAAGASSAILGGKGNTASGSLSFVGGGGYNFASGFMSTIVGGGDEFGLFRNIAIGGHAFVGGGSVNYALGGSSSVLGGFNNVAGGAASVAMGRSARTQPVTCPENGGLPSAAPCPMAHDGTFVFSDGSAARFRSFANHSFNVLASGGVRFVTAATQVAGEATSDKYVDILPDGRLSFVAGATTKITLDDATPARAMGTQPGTVYQRSDGGFAWYLNGTESPAQNDPGLGGAVLATLTDAATSTTVTGTFRALAFTATSDREQKMAFATVDPLSVLAKVAELPVMTWSYKSEASRGIRHIGPVSQDFVRLFGVGYNDKSIATVDADGVALAAIQGLKQELDKKSARIEELERRLANVERALLRRD